MNLTSALKKTDVQRDWIVLDAKDEIFGRLITKTATYLRGKHKPSYTPNIDCGDFVVIINAKEAKFSGLKLNSKEYFTHSGYFGSTKSKTLTEMLEKHPEKLFRLAVRGMLPKTKLGKVMIGKLKVYSGSEHPHTAQVSKQSKKD